MCVADIMTLRGKHYHYFLHFTDKVRMVRDVKYSPGKKGSQDLNPVWANSKA